MNTTPPLAHFVQGFFQDYLAAQKGLSPNTILSYRDALKLFLRFTSQRVKKPADKLVLQDFDEKSAADFLDDLEANRGNCPAARNNRLAALRAFFRYVASQEPLALARCQRICAIPAKRTEHRTIEYLEGKEMGAVLESVDRNSWKGLRDYALLLFLYNTGARVQEIVALNIADLRLQTPFQVKLTGKGKKERLCPLWPEAVAAIEKYFTLLPPDASADSPVFVNSNKRRITRFGIRYLVRRYAAQAAQLCPSVKSKKVSPHTFRHYLPFLIMSCSATLASIHGRWRGDKTNIVLTPLSLDMRGKEFIVKCVINDQVVLSRAPEGPLAAHIATFAKSQSELGYAPYSIHRQILLAACFSHWLRQEGVELRQVSSDHPSRYLRYRARRIRLGLGDAAALRQLVNFLRCEGLIAAEEISARRLTSVERCAEAYAHYLREARALARATIVNYVPFIRGFLTNRFRDRPVMLSRLSACDVVRFVQRQAPLLHLKRAKLLTTALRSFLRYARYRGEVTLDLAAAVPIVANWSMKSIPRAIGADQVRQLLSSIDRFTAIGRRDYAILLLLARLGLRSGEVAFLELDDIAWDAGQVSVRGKGGQRTALPLPTDVGEAIVGYLRHGRPHSTDRHVFLRNKAPIRGFLSQCAIGSIIRHALHRAGIQAPTMGAHQFRHALACQMLRHGASLTEIGEVLRHRSPQTTTIYAKVDLKALRTLALPWPGGAR